MSKAGTQIVYSRLPRTSFGRAIHMVRMFRLSGVVHGAEPFFTELVLQGNNPHMLASLASRDTDSSISPCPSLKYR